MRRWRSFLKSERGAGTVEFVTILPAFLAIFFLVIEVAGAWFWWKTAEKAVQLGARVAIVRDAAATGVPARNPKRAGGQFGIACGHTSNPCDFDAQTEWVCTAGDAGCNPDQFQDILSEIRRLMGNVPAENVTITYRYVALGFAGGPFIPAVTVTLSDLPFGLFLGFLANLAGAGDYATLPDISATLTGEDLSAAGVGV